MAKIIIVNEKDEIIGEVERQDETWDDICRVSALWIENSKGDVLLAQRSFKKRYNPGKWGPAVSGTVEVGETYDSNIYKEAEEEIGLVGYEFEKIQKIRTSRSHNYFCQWYRLAIDKDIEYFRIDPEEVEQIRWFSRDELRKAVEAEPEKFGTTIKAFLNGEW